MTRAITVFAAALLMATQVFAMEVPVEQTEQMVDGRQTLVKVFEVGPDVDPETLIDDDFQRKEFVYSLESIVKEVVNSETERDITMPKSLLLDIGDEDEAREKALEQFPVFIEYEEDGFSGKLYPMVNTFNLEETGRTSHSGKKTLTKTYTSEYNDDSAIPQTITENGSTYTAASISWADGAYIQDSTIPEGYVATVTYSRGYSYTTIDGFDATMYYTGKVTKESETMIRYTVTYIGTVGTLDENGQTVVTMPNEKSSAFKGLAIGIGCAAIAGIAAGIILQRNRKSKMEQDPEDIEY